jgi:chromosome segregation ATPase
MSEEDFDFTRVKDLINSLRETDAKIADRLKGLAKEIKELSSLKHEFEARMRVVESRDFEEMRQSIYGIEGRMKSFEAQHDDSKEKWRTALNFVVQLLWVSMAAWLLTKLGLQGPL